MIRKLSALGLASAATLTLAILALSAAGATEEEIVPVYFSAGVGSEETAQIDGAQAGSNTITVSGSPALTCETIEYDGEALNPEEAFEVLITPKYSGCHMFVEGITKTATVVSNGCAFEVAAQETLTESPEGDFIAEIAIVCPEGKTIEIAVYNTSKSEHVGASTLCTYKIAPQTGLTGTTLTNNEGDVSANFKMESIAGSGSGICTGKTVAYKGEATLQATNEASESVALQVKNKKVLFFDIPKPIAKGEKGEMEIRTEKVTVTCTAVEYEAKPGVIETSALAFKPTYAGCTAFGGKNEVQIKPEGCQYKTEFNKNIEFPVAGVSQTPASFEVSCGANESVKVTVTKQNDKVNVECSIVIPGANPVDTLKFRNNSLTKSGLKVDTLILVHDVSGLTYEPQNNPTTCGKNQKLTDGKIIEGPTKKEFLVKASDGKGNESGMLIKGSMAP